LNIPTWFDEGLAMQVDYRPQYALAAEDEHAKDTVRQLTSSTLFFNSDKKMVVSNYAKAHALVADWVVKVGKGSVYRRLEQIRDGNSFEDAISNRFSKFQAGIMTRAKPLIILIDLPHFNPNQQNPIRQKPPTINPNSISQNVRRFSLATHNKSHHRHVHWEISADQQAAPRPISIDRLLHRALAVWCRE